MSLLPVLDSVFKDPVLHTSHNPSVFSFSFHQSSRTCRMLFFSLRLFLAVIQKLMFGAVSTVVHGPFFDVSVCQLLLLTILSLWVHTLLKMLSSKSLFWWLSGKTELFIECIWSGFELWPMCTSAVNSDQFLNDSYLQTVSEQWHYNSRRNRSVFNAQIESKWGSCQYQNYNIWNNDSFLETFICKLFKQCLKFWI